MTKPKLVYAKVDGSWYLGRWDKPSLTLKDAQYVKHMGEADAFKFWITNKAIEELSDLKLEGQVVIITKALTKKEETKFFNLIDIYNQVEETAMARLVNSYFYDA